MATNNDLYGTKLEILVMYKECIHNHAAKTMGYALDGCGQFVANGPNGTSEAMVCAVCECHRNFHRRVEVELPAYDGIPENNNPSQQNAGVTLPASLPHPQPQQQHLYQQNPTSHARTFVPSTSARRNQINQGEGLQLRTNPTRGSQRPFGMQSEYRYQPRGLTHRLSQGSRVPVDRAPRGQMMEAGLRVHRNRITEEQSQALRTISERNNWKMFRHYAKEEVEQICSVIGITRSVMKSWIHRHRHKRAAEATAAANQAAAAEAATEEASSSESDNENNE